MPNKDDKLIYLTLALSNAESLEILRMADSAEQALKTANALAYPETDTDRKKIYRLKESAKFKYFQIGQILTGNLMVRPTKLDRTAAVSIWNAALVKGLPSEELVDLLRRLQLQVTGRLSDPIGFFLRESGHELLLKRQKVDGVQPSPSSCLKGHFLSVESDDVLTRKRRVLLSELLDALQDRFGITPVGKREAEIAGLNTGNDELCSVFTCKGRTVIISVL